MAALLLNVYLVFIWWLLHFRLQNGTGVQVAHLSFLSVVPGSQCLCLVLITDQFMTPVSLMSGFFLSFFHSFFLFSTPLCSPSPSLSLSVWAVWMSSYIISMPLAVIIDSFCRSCPPPSRSLTRNSEEICELYHLQRSSFLLRIPTGSALSSPPDLF